MINTIVTCITARSPRVMGVKLLGSVNNTEQGRKVDKREPSKSIKTSTAAERREPTVSHKKPIRTVHRYV